jgi:hypothetical protein
VLFYPVPQITQPRSQRFNGQSLHIANIGRPVFLCGGKIPTDGESAPDG